ncbi:hypothetical protein [Nocardia cyriacigeorgica]|uniref:hypothetical protein n=1 Tax=Nocardia cyriacigeorgica TaxID=135487 RepID=UPI0024562D71|nr:hypothetical protein [Nocardia cyriacigeorgica]
MPAGLIDLIMRRRRAVLVLFAVLLMLAGAGSSTLFDKLKGGGFNDPGAESGVAAEVLRDQFGQGQPNLVLLVDGGGPVDDPGTVAAATALVQRLTGEDDVTGVTSYWTSGRGGARGGGGGDGHARGVGVNPAHPGRAGGGAGVFFLALVRPPPPPAPRGGGAPITPPPAPPPRLRASAIVYASRAGFIGCCGVQV